MNQLTNVLDALDTVVLLLLFDIMLKMGLLLLLYRTEAAASAATVALSEAINRIVKREDSDTEKESSRKL